MFAMPAFAQAADAAPGAEALASLLPLLLISIPIAIGNYFLAKRIDGASPVAWLVLSLIPLVNFAFWYYIAYKVVFNVLDLERLLAELAQQQSGKDADNHPAHTVAAVDVNAVSVFVQDVPHCQTNSRSSDEPLHGEHRQVQGHLRGIERDVPLEMEMKSAHRSLR